MKTLLTTLLLLVISGSLYAQKGRCWSVANTSNPNFGACPYEVCLSMVLLNSSQQVVPNSGISMCHTITTGNIANYCYPHTIPAGCSVVVTNAFLKVNGILYDLPLNSSIIYYNLSSCNASCNVLTFWDQASQTGYQITGDCVLGGG